ncbi:aminotransferase class V-fold PLP-dependent enzyme [Paenibacillus sp. 598K]|uniref:pyridoxal-phosphate-dependent aminotransferase family protein n=1 Tax=Paenibacillus sp. 598K TaxID=1117987 RepID=UPI000FF925BD|nr:alanine--glyoxylate aminotransferase family protein [Paenibacillus sp. 598K]GBF77971.1 aminotransferase class V-fold PLP-dependent enzyme [Paenibacillus sp. 598K]
MRTYPGWSPPPRTIMTPGPVEVDPRVLRAMAAPIVGQFDPAFTSLMNTVMDQLRDVFQTTNRWAYPVDGTSRSGLEAALVSLIEPGDTVLVPIYGRFGYLLHEIASRCGAQVIALSCEWGRTFAPETIVSAIRTHQPQLVAMVHGETSTGQLQPMDGIGSACREVGALLVVDAVATLGGVPVQTDAWQLDAVIGGTQKCLSVPAGLAPVTYNGRAEAKLLQRKRIERGLRAPAAAATAVEPTAAVRESLASDAIRSNYLDLSQLQDYWSPARLNHHTEATSMIYALYEGLRLVTEEGVEARWARHRQHEEALVSGIEAMGLTLYGDRRTKLPVVTCITIPDGVDGESVRSMLLDRFGLEIASSFGPLQGKIWRIGTMGYSCSMRNILFTLGALEAVLTWHGVPVVAGAAVQAALRVYEGQAVEAEERVQA